MVQDDFLGGDDWSSVLEQDCSRLASDGKLRVGPGGAQEGEFVLLEPVAELEGKLPALYEVLLNLRALPYELNRKVPSMRLADPLPGKCYVGHMASSPSTIL